MSGTLQARPVTPMRMTSSDSPILEMGNMLTSVQLWSSSNSVDSISDKRVECRPPKDGYGGWNYERGPAESALRLYQVQLLGPDHCLGPAPYIELAIDVVDV